MTYNILIGGSAGQGMETIASILEKSIQRFGYEVFTTRDYMSRVRGGHNFIQIRFGLEDIKTHSNSLNVIVALNQETVDNHKKRLVKNGMIIHDDEVNCEKEFSLNLKMKEYAKSVGNIRTFGSVAVGAFVKLFGFDINALNDTIKVFIKNEVIFKQNIEAAKMGYNNVDKLFEIEKGNKNSGKILINGNEAVALGALAADLRFYSAYPMTPSTSIMNYLAGKSQESNIIVEQAEDEIAAINMAIGASYAGVRAMTSTSGGGFSLMVEALGLSGIMEIPLVIAEIQRPGPATGFPTRTEQSDLKFIISASHGEFPRMVIALKNPEDAFYQTVRAFNIADKYQIPVLILSDQYLADSTNTINEYDFSKVIVNKNIEEISEGKEYKKYDFKEGILQKRVIPGLTKGVYVNVDSDEHDEEGYITESAEVRIKMVNRRLEKFKLLKNELIEPEVIGEEKFDILLIGWGSMYSPLYEATKIINNEGVKCQSLIFGDIWPLPEKIITEKSKKAKMVINVEQNATGQLGAIISEVTGIKCDHSILKYDGRQISAEEIKNKLMELIIIKK